MNTEITLWHIIGIIGLVLFLILVVVAIISIIISLMTELRTRKGDVQIKSGKMIRSVNKGLKKTYNKKN